MAPGGGAQSWAQPCCRALGPCTELCHVPVTGAMPLVHAPSRARSQPPSPSPILWTRSVLCSLQPLPASPPAGVGIGERGGSGEPHRAGARQAPAPRGGLGALGWQHLRAHAEEPLGRARIRSPHEDAGQPGEHPAPPHQQKWLKPPPKNTSFDTVLLRRVTAPATPTATPSCRRRANPKATC